MTVTTGSDALHLQFCDGRTSNIPYSFLRDNCKCHKCRADRNTAINSDFEVAVHPEIIQVRKLLPNSLILCMSCIVAFFITFFMILCITFFAIWPFFPLQSNVLGVVIDWSDGHISKYSGEWLHDATHDLNFYLS